MADNHSPTPLKEQDQQDKASWLLNTAHGIASMCNGLVSDPPPDRKIDWSSIKRSLEYVARLTGEAVALMRDAKREAVADANAVALVIAADAVNEAPGLGAGPHLHQEITAWATQALCDVLERARDAVDAAEATHG